jgi:predicted glycoside hydrolase/deacetylase ChbG (UPF0249 family)
MKHIILCADDYGQTLTISQAIIDLLTTRRLTATSCMVTSHEWPLCAGWLIPFINQVDIGLHFNLTEGVSLSGSHREFMPLSHLLLKSHLRLLNKKVIRDELNAQLDRFVSVMGVLPDFIDGHQHVHQFPMIRDVLLEVYEERLRQHRCYIRSISAPRAFWSAKISDYGKKLILQLSGAVYLKKRLVELNIPHNSSFSGVYSFGSPDQYEAVFSTFLTDIENEGLIMCHPGYRDDSADDLIHEARFKEFTFISSEQYFKVLSNAGVSLTTFKNFIK